MFVKRKISYLPDFPDIERFVSIYRFEACSKYKYLKLWYEIQYVKDGKDVTTMFNANLPSWEVTNNYKVFVLGPDGNSIPNPEYIDEVQTPEVEEYLRMSAFDYFKLIIFDVEEPVKIKDIMNSYIDRDDIVNNRFNFI